MKEQININYSMGTLMMDSVIACRKTVHQNNAQEILDSLEIFISKNSLEKKSELINVTHGVETCNEEVFLDLEVLVSVGDFADKIIDVEGVRIIKKFILNNALICHIKCSPLQLKNYNKEIEDYIVSNGFIAVTPGYLISRKPSDFIKPTDAMEFEIYIGLQTDEKNRL